MIGNNKRYNYSKSRLIPVMSVCHEHLGWGASRPTSVDRDRLPQPYSDLGPDYCSDIPYDLGPEIYTRLVNINYKYCLRTLVYLGGT